MKKWDIKKIAELAYAYFLGLRILLHDTDSRKWAQDYCKRAGEPNDFDTWRTSGNDLYAMMYALSDNPDDTDEDKVLPHRIVISPMVVRTWLRNPTDISNTHKFFTRLDSMFHVDNSSMKSVRRIVANIESSTAKERQDCLDKIIQYIHTRAPSNSEIISHLRDLKTGDDDTKITEYTMLKSLRIESASSGGTSAASIATSVGGLGAGFDPDGDWRSVYGPKKKAAKKPIVIRRPKIEEETDPRFDDKYRAFDYKDNNYTKYARDMKMMDGLRYVYYQIPMFRQDGFEIQVRVFDDKERKKIAASGFDDEGGSWSVWVDESYRGNGIGNKMYDWVSDKLGKIIHPATKSQTKDGQAFWTKRNSR